MARQVLRKSTSLDRLGYRLVVDTYCGDYAEDISDSESHPGLRYATEVVRCIGPQYSYAYVGVPVNEFGAEWAPAVALQRTGPAGQVKLRSRAKVSMIDSNGKSVPLLVGYLTQYAHSIDEDSVVGMVMDDRWLLSKVTVFGRGTYDPVTSLHYFDAGLPCTFNLDGYPDCVDSPHGPRFAPGRLFGYKKTEEVEDSNEPTKGDAGTRARSWTCQDVVQYLRDMYYRGQRPPHPQDYGRQQVSRYVDWPSSLGNQHGFVRVPRHFECENLEVGEALARTCRKAGPYEILMEPNGWRGRLGIVQVDTRRGGTMLTGPTYGSDDPGGDISDALDDSTRVSGGSVMESIVGYFDDVCVAGDPPVIEHQFSEADPNSGETPVELEPAWSDEEEEAFKSIIGENGEDESAFLMACKAQPRVYCSWKISAAYVAYAMTKWAGWSPPTNPRLLPRLLSGYAQGNNNPRDWNPRETVLEYLDESETGEEGSGAESGTWKPCSRFDEFTLIDDGTAFMVEALRSGGERVSFHSDGYDPETFRANKMRITCAVEREFRITGKASDDPNNTRSRVASHERFTYLTVAEPGDYSHWERYLSRPNGNAVDEPYLSEMFPDKRGGAYLFSDLVQGGSDSRINRHATHRLKDVKRIDYHGVLTMHTWNPSLRPGMQAWLDVGGNSIVPVAVIRAVRFNSMSQAQEIELMAADNSTIYDIPLPPPPQTAGGAPAPEAKKTPSPQTGEEDYEDDVKRVEGKDEYSQEQAAPRSSSGSAPETPDQKAKREAAMGIYGKEDDIIGEMERTAVKESTRAVANATRGSVMRPGEQGWERMRHEENQAPAGIFTGPALRARDAARSRRRADVLATREAGEEPRAPRPSTPYEERALKGMLPGERDEEEE